MRTSVTFLFLLTSVLVSAQKTLDTIFANDKMNVSLFFPNPVRQGLTGEDNFTFTYNREKEQYFGLLQASPGDQSNLLVITNDGQVYSYILKYASNISRLNYFVSKNESIGNEQPIPESQKSVVDTIGVKNEEKIYSKRFSEYLLKSRESPLVIKRKKGMILRLLNVVYNKSDVYLVMEIKNKSGIDFEMDYLNVFIENDNKRWKSSSQKLLQNVIFKYENPKLIFDKGTKRFVYVLPKFVLEKNEKLFIEAKEMGGNRTIGLNY